jgi:zinc transport system substrate-binding protein
MNVMNNRTRTALLIMLWSGLMSLLLIAVGSCHQSSDRIDKPIIAVSILPQKFFVEKIAGVKFIINVMVPAGANHENYDPSPQQIIGLSDAVVYFRIGNIDFENIWVKKFSENYPDLKFVNLSTKIDLIKPTGEAYKYEQSDPHTWMSPANVKIMAKTIYETLVELDLKNEQFYTNNYKQFLNEIDSVNLLVRAKFQNARSNSFIIYHPALTYYARDFGLIQLAIELDGKGPSVKHITELIDIAKREKIKAVLVQRQFDITKAETIANEIGGKVIEIDPLNENWSQEIIDITNKLSETFIKKNN